jgi:6-phosphogluconolactonase (cycloisomerase 2 family)
MGEPSRIAIDERNGLVWVAGYRKNSISAIDVRDPKNPQFIRDFENDYFNRVQTIAYHNEHLYVGSRESNSTVVFKVTVNP